MIEKGIVDWHTKKPLLPPTLEFSLDRLLIRRAFGNIEKENSARLELG
jgi:hypothetical protein